MIESGLVADRPLDAETPRRANRGLDFAAFLLGEVVQLRHADALGRDRIVLDVPLQGEVIVGDEEGLLVVAPFAS